MANQFLSLALFLMLLSFFIVMNAISSFENTKSAPVINSLALAFSNRALKQDVNSSIMPPIGESINNGDTLEVLEGLFNAHLSGATVTKNRLGTVMHVKVLIDQFEELINIYNEDYNINTLGGKGSFAPTMISLLRSENKNMPYRVDMILNIPEEPSNFQENSPDEFMSSLKRMSLFAKTLEDAGMPKKMLSIGMAKGDIGFIDLYFYRYKPFDLYAQIKKASEE